MSAQSTWSAAASASRFAAKPARRRRFGGVGSGSSPARVRICPLGAVAAFFFFLAAAFFALSFAAASAAAAASFFFFAPAVGFSDGAFGAWTFFGGGFPPGLPSSPVVSVGVVGVVVVGAVSVGVVDVVVVGVVSVGVVAVVVVGVVSVGTGDVTGGTVGVVTVGSREGTVGAVTTVEPVMPPSARAPLGIRNRPGKSSDRSASVPATCFVRRETTGRGRRRERRERGWGAAAAGTGAGSSVSASAPTS